jgi:NAD(P)-dependent dehydrogenase (short-subunit alcohol dehydrogenase family)
MTPNWQTTASNVWSSNGEASASACPGDVSNAGHCRSLVAQTVDALGRANVLVNNVVHQMSFQSIEEISDEE